MNLRAFITVRTKLHQALAALAACLAICAFAACSEKAANGDAADRLQAEIATLDRLARQAPEFDRKKQASIDSVKSLCRSAGRKRGLQLWQCYQRLGDDYKSFSSDSSVIYYNKAMAEARRLGNDSLLTLSRMGRINALAAAGIFASAQHELAMIDTAGLSRDLRIERAKAARQLYSYMTFYVEGHEYVAPEVQDNLAYYTGYLLENMNPTDPYRQVLGYEHLVSTGDYRQAKPKLEAMLKALPRESNLYGRAAFQLAQVYLHEGKEEDYARSLALASESDLEGSVKEGLALPSLALWLYNNGDTKRAYDYINLSMKDAKNGNARMRTGMIANAISVIDAAYQDRIKSSRKWISFFLILAIVLLIAAIWLLVVSHKRKRRISEASDKLRQFTRVQDSYIGHFIGLCASYSDKLSSMSKLVSRKISSGQADDLLKMVKSGKFADEQSEDFFSHFDRVFLDLYPDFVFEINKLLREDSKIIPKTDGTLNAELRIYAFVRLGVEESVKISKILHYSPATIYTYRNKMRNRAINRDTFDADVMKICSHT